MPERVWTKNGIERWRLPELIVLLLISFAILAGKNYGTTSDPHGGMLVSMALIEHGTIRLDEYRTVLQQGSYPLIMLNWHVYYFFPLGTSLLSVPFVAIAKWCGLDPIVRQGVMQLIIAAMVLMASFVVMRKIAQLYLAPLASNVVAASYLLGSSFISTGATALWSHDFAALFALLALYALLADKKAGSNRRWPLLAISLFVAYLCRPTLLLLAPVAIGIQFFFIDRFAALKTAALVAVFALGFIVFSMHEFNLLLPPYYLPQRLDSNTFWTALYGNLLSPARGLLVYSPFLLLPLLGIVSLWRRLPAYRPEIILLVWPLLHWMVISKFPHWWGGFSFGSRLMYDVLPGLFVAWVVYVQQLNLRSWQGAGAVVAVVFAIGVNYVQGVFNPNTGIWCAEPNIDQHPELLFDWRYPQFLHTADRHARRLYEFRVSQQTNRLPTGPAEKRE